MTNGEFIDLVESLIYCKIWAKEEALHANLIETKLRSYTVEEVDDYCSLVAEDCSIQMHSGLLQFFELSVS